MSGLAHQASDRAALWILLQEDPDWNESQQVELDAWLQESPLHRAAYLRLRYSWRQADVIGDGDHTPKPNARFAPAMSNWRWQPWALAASILAVVSVGGASVFNGQNVELAATTFETRVGALETVALSDGSKIELNTATRVRASISDKTRDIWLDQGEAYFEVRHREGQQFIVHAGTRKITVLGTKFSVRREGDKVSVAVAEGRVRVDDVRNPAAVRSAIINGGDLAIARGPSLIAVSAEDKVQNALSWREGMLTFSDTTLENAAAEFSRYSQRTIVVTDPAVAAIRIDGAFQANNIDAFLRLLGDAYGLRIDQDSNQVRISN